MILLRLRTRRWSEEVKQKSWQQISTMPFGDPANVKLKLPINWLRTSYWSTGSTHRGQLVIFQMLMHRKWGQSRTINELGSVDKRNQII
jgi:hypothetical protein